MDKKVEQLKLYLESIAEYDETLVNNLKQVVNVIFENEEPEYKGEYSPEDVKLVEKVKGFILGGYKDLPSHVKEKVAARNGVTIDDMERAVTIFNKMYPDTKEEFSQNVEAKLAKAE